MRLHRDHTVLAAAACAAFAVAMLAVSGHAAAVESGYRLSAARREGEVLLREALNAERRCATLRLPPAVAQRATQVHRLALQHPKDRRVLTEAQVALLLAPPAVSPVPVPGAPPAGVMAK